MFCITAQVEGESRCDGCDPGQYQEFTNDTALCSKCPIGYYNNAQNLKVCYECPLGYFANTQPSLDGEVLFDQCESCP